MTVIEPSTGPHESAVPTIALALGGGGARGLAHIAVLEVLDELAIKPRIIAGTSIGALFGAAYASGLRGTQIRAFALETLGRRFDLIRQLIAARSDPVQHMLRLLPIRSSFLNAEALMDLVMPSGLARSFEDLKIPLYVVATDFAAREQTVLTSGALKPAIAASIAIPVVFQPVTIGERVLVDGGLVNPLPFELVLGKADITIAVDASGASTAVEPNSNPRAVEVLIQSVQIMEKSITRQKLRHIRPDIYLDIEADRFGALEFYKPDEILAAAEPLKAKLREKLRSYMPARRLAGST